MGFTEILTVIFVVLKIFEVISWPWWLVFMPEIIAFVVYAIMLITHVMFIHRVNRHIRRSIKWRYKNF